MKNKIYHLLYDLFLKLRLHRLVNPITHTFEVFTYLSHFSKWIQAYQPPILDDKRTNRDITFRRFQLHQFLFEKQIQQIPILYLEFGVWEGKSIRWWSEHNKNPASAFVGFDTFTGLPEQWFWNEPGTFNVDGQFPKIEDSRVRFVQGLFQNTLQNFLQSPPLSNQRRVIHLDADLYSSTFFVLSQLHSFGYLQKNDILIFDELSDVISEFRALKDFSESFYREYRVLGAVNNYTQVAIQILN